MKPRFKDNLFGKEILFYCKDCEKLVDAHKVGRKHVYRCAICKTKNVAFGTEKSLINFFHISDESEKDKSKEENKKPEEGEKKAETAK